MKKTLLVFLITVLFSGTFSCQEKNKAELIPNTEVDYTFIKSNPWEQKKADVFSFEYDQIKIWSEAMKEVQKQVKIKGDSEEFEYALYVNENGKIDKLKPLKGSDPKIDQFLSTEMNNWEMVKHFENDKPHKYRIDLNFSIWKNKKGVMNVISSNFPIIDEYKGEDFITYTDKMPAPIGGIKGIQEKIKYPELAKRAGIEGRVFVKAFIDKNGNVVATQVIKGVGTGCDEAAIYAVEKTKFIPASWKGENVGAQIAVPILFKLDSKTKNSNRAEKMIQKEIKELKPKKDRAKFIKEKTEKK